MTVAPQDQPSLDAQSTPGMAADTPPPAKPPQDAGGAGHGAPGASSLSAEMEREIDEAMQAATEAGDEERGERKSPGAGEQRRPGKPRAPERSSAPTPVGGHAKPAIRGPRVVQAGREHRTGRVVSIGPDDIFIEFGPKELGVAGRKQWTDEELPKVGDSMEVVVDRFEPNEQLYVCSRPGAVQKAEWELLEPGQVVEARVTGVNKGGLELEVAGHRAFMPASRVDVRHIDDLSPFVGQKIACKVKQVDRSGRGNIVLSRREVVAADQKQQRAKLKETLQEGQTVEGVVRKIMPFGAFVDIGGVDALIHISDLSHDRVHRVEQVLKEGQSVSAKVLKIDWENDRISLGLKQATEDPFATAASDIKSGAEVTGRVTKLMEFGAFVELAPGVEGLIHISELSWQRVATAGHVVKQDQVITVKVLEVDPERRRIGLSLKQMSEPPQAPAGKGRGGRGGKEVGRSIEEIRQETPAQRRAREKFQAEQKAKNQGLKSGLGDVEGIGLGEIGKLTLG